MRKIRLIFTAAVLLATQSLNIYAKQPEGNSFEAVSSEAEAMDNTSDESSSSEAENDEQWLIEGTYTSTSAGKMAAQMTALCGDGTVLSADTYTLWYHRSNEKISSDEVGDVYEAKRIVVRENTDLTGTVTMVSEEIQMPHMTDEEHEKWDNPIEGLEWGMTAKEISELYDVTDNGDNIFILNENYELFGQAMKITLTLDELIGLVKITGEYDVEQEGKTGEILEAIYGPLENEGSGMWSYSYGTVSDIRTNEQVKQMYREIYADPDMVSDTVVLGVMMNSLETVRLKELDGYGLFEMNASMLLFFGAVD